MEKRHDINFVAAFFLSKFGPQSTFNDAKLPDTRDAALGAGRAFAPNRGDRLKFWSGIKKEGALD